MFYEETFILFPKLICWSCRLLSAKGIRISQGRNDGVHNMQPPTNNASL